MRQQGKGLIDGRSVGDEVRAVLGDPRPCWPRDVWRFSVAVTSRARSTGGYPPRERAVSSCEVRYCPRLGLLPAAMRAAGFQKLLLGGRRGFGPLTLEPLVRLLLVEPTFGHRLVRERDGEVDEPAEVVRRAHRPLHCVVALDASDESGVDHRGDAALHGP